MDQVPKVPVSSSLLLLEISASANFSSRNTSSMESWLPLRAPRSEIKHLRLDQCCQTFKEVVKFWKKSTNPVTLFEALMLNWCEFKIQG
jgi:hypothetical protein